MRSRTRVLVAAAVALVGGSTSPRASRADDGVAWGEWTPAAFAAAGKVGKIVLVEVSASWCHWCHVMERTTYRDARVLSRLAARFVPIKVDADARPDLAERYAEYHWPATVFLWPDGREILALRGYRSADEFLPILAQVDAAARAGRSLFDAGPSAAKTTVTSADAVPLESLRARLFATVQSTWDDVAGGWGFGQKYPHAPCVEHALLEARLSGDRAWQARALRTLAAWEALIDPVWGGMYQYSEGGVWSRPHYEKIMAVQAGAISAYADAYRRTRDARWIRDANAVRRFLVETLRTPSGAFMTSQDADLRRADGSFVDGTEYFALDDAGRRALGMPRIDPAVYAQENGWAIKALCDLYAVSGDATALEQARAAAKAIVATHRDPAGGWRHAAGDVGPAHLGDQAAFGRALLALHSVTGERAWMDEAWTTAEAMQSRFLDERRGGFFSTSASTAGASVYAERVRPFEGNAAAARFLIALDAVAGGQDVADGEPDTPFRPEALRALGAISDPGLVERFGWRAATALLATEEATFPWVRVVVFSRSKEDADGEAFWRALLTADEPLLVWARMLPTPRDPPHAIVIARMRLYDAKRVEDLIPAIQRLRIKAR